MLFYQRKKHAFILYDYTFYFVSYFNMSALIIKKIQDAVGKEMLKQAEERTGGLFGCADDIPSILCGLFVCVSFSLFAIFYFFLSFEETIAAVFIYLHTNRKKKETNEDTPSSLLAGLEHPMR